MTQFDFIAGGLLLVACGYGYARGATHQMTRILAFVLAAILAMVSLRITGGAARALIDPDWIGVGVALLTVFGLIYFGLRLLGAGLEQHVREAEVLGVLDRTLGAGFGFVRAMIILGGFNLLFHMATPMETAPTWVTGALTWPATEAAGRVLETFAPHGAAVVEHVGPALENAVREGATAPPDAEMGYEARERDAVDDLVEKTR